jgi:hypothetical protein
VARAVRVTRFDQGALRQVFNALDRMALEQPRAGHGRELFTKQPLCAGGDALRHGIAQREVDVGSGEIDCVVGGIDADVDVGVVALKGLQARDQPHRSERGPGGDGHALAPGALANLPHARINALQRGGRRTQQLRACAGEFHRAGVTKEQGSADLVFQRLNLTADRALCERELLGGRTEIEVARHRFEGAQVAGGNRPGAGMAAGELHGRAPRH